jgi:hypothetical protein
MEEGRRLIAAGRAAAPTQNDPIAALLSQVQPVLEQIDLTVVAIRKVAETLNRDLQGQGSGPLASTLKDVAGTAHEVKRCHPAGRHHGQPGTGAGTTPPAWPGVLDPKVQWPPSWTTTIGYDQIQGSLQGRAVIAQLAEFTAS